MHSDATKSDSTTTSELVAAPSGAAQVSDLDLLNALRDGQLEALSILYNRYASLVYGLAVKILSDSQEAEDVTQDVFLTLWHRDAYNPSRGSLSGFLITMTRSRSIDRLRSRQTRTRFFQRWRQTMSTETNVSPLEQASLGERSQLVKAALEKLPTSERQVLEIAYYEGLSQVEIANRLETPLGTVKTRSRQGLIKLRKLLQDCIQ